MHTLTKPDDFYRSEPPLKADIASKVYAKNIICITSDSSTER